MTTYKMNLHKNSFYSQTYFFARNTLPLREDDLWPKSKTCLGFKIIIIPKFLDLNNVLVSGITEWAKKLVILFFETWSLKSNMFYISLSQVKITPLTT